MPTVRLQNELPPGDYMSPDGAGGNFATISRQIIYTTLYVSAASGLSNKVMLGGMQSFGGIERHGSTFQAMQGNDWNELIMRQRFVNGSARRYMPRGNDIRTVMTKIYPNILNPINGASGLTSTTAGADIDWRVYPVIFFDQFMMYDPTGQIQVENTSWTYYSCTLDNVAVSKPDTFGYVEESWDYISKGIEFYTSSGGGIDVAPNSYLLGTGPRTS